MDKKVGLSDSDLESASASSPETITAADNTPPPDVTNGPVVSHPPSKPGSKKTLMMIVAVLILLLGAGAAAYLLTSKDKKTTTNNAVVKETGDILIGVNTDLTAPGTAAFGISMKQGVELATEEINAKGGILGRKVRAIVLDDKADIETSKKNTEQLIKQDKVHAIISPTHATNAAAWIDMAQDSETTVILPAAPSTALTTKFAQRPRNYIFRVNTTDGNYAEINVSWSITKTNNGKIAILASNTAYGQQGAKDVTEVLARWGKTPVIASTFSQGTNLTDIAKNIAAIKAAGADAIILQTTADDSATILKALDAAKYNPVLAGSSANLSPALPKGAGALASKLTFGTGVGAALNEKTKELNTKLTAKNTTATPVFAVAAQAYDSTYMLKAAIEKAGSTDRKAYRDALENLSGFKGVIKDFGKPFSKTNHESMGPRDIYLVHWVGAQLVPYTQAETGTLEIR